MSKENGKAERKSVDFGKKSCRFIVRIADHFPGRYEELLVYSVLVKAIRGGLGLTKEVLAQRTGLERGRTVRVAVDTLVKHGLAEVQQDGKVYATEPGNKQWFHWKSKAKDDWFDRFLYHVEFVLVPDVKDGLSLRENSVYWLCVSWWNDTRYVPHVATLATQLGLHRQTIAACLETLVKKKLLERDEPEMDQAVVVNEAGDRNPVVKRRSAKGPLRVRQPEQDYWLKIEEPKGGQAQIGVMTVEALAESLVGQKFHSYKPKLVVSSRDLFSRLVLLLGKMREAHYSDEDIRRVFTKPGKDGSSSFWKECGFWQVAEAFVVNFAWGLFRFVEVATQENAGTTFSGRNSSGAFRQIGLKIVRRMRVMRDQGNSMWDKWEPDYAELWYGKRAPC